MKPDATRSMREYVGDERGESHQVQESEIPRGPCGSQGSIRPIPYASSTVSAHADFI
jgi:hypothetical protein